MDTAQCSSLVHHHVDKWTLSFWAFLFLMFLPPTFAIKTSIWFNFFLIIPIGWRNSEFVDKKFKLEIVILLQFLRCFRPGGCAFGHGSFVVWGHHFRSTFIASGYKYILNKECIKGEEVEKVFSGSRIRHNSFADFIILFRGFHPLQYYVLVFLERIQYLSNIQIFFVYIYFVIPYSLTSIKFTRRKTKYEVLIVEISNYILVNFYLIFKLYFFIFEGLTLFLETVSSVLRNHFFKTLS